jgi:hypothetical protein
MTDLIEAYAAEVSRQSARQIAKQPGPDGDWQAGYAKGVKIARNMQQQRGHRVPDHQGK